MKQQIKERPIIFSAEMVKAILEGRKTQTRRVLKLSFYESNFTESGVVQLANRLWRIWASCDGATLTEDLNCPYGTPGTRLWVREAWQAWAEYDHLKPSGIPQEKMAGRVNYLANGNKWDARYRHARFMPRWASRIMLEITSVRVERLQDISEDDAKAEGMIAVPTGGAEVWQMRNPAPAVSYRHGYCFLWHSIHGVNSWGQNPWVWVIEFRRLEAK